jgi:hypothetical protein
MHARPYQIQEVVFFFRNRAFSRKSGSSFRYTGLTHNFATLRENASVVRISSFFRSQDIIILYTTSGTWSVTCIRLDVVLSDDDNTSWEEMAGGPGIIVDFVQDIDGFPIYQSYAQSECNLDARCSVRCSHVLWHVTGTGCERTDCNCSSSSSRYPEVAVSSVHV